MEGPSEQTIFMKSFLRKTPGPPPAIRAEEISYETRFSGTFQGILTASSGKSQVFLFQRISED